VALSFHEEVGSSLSIFNDSNLILTYNYHSDLCKPYFHPVNAPNAKSVTSDTPEDNINHHGLWFGWGNVNGIDFWKEGAGKHNVNSETKKFQIALPELSPLTIGPHQKEQY